MFSSLIESIGIYLFSFLVLSAILVLVLWILTLVDCLKSRKKSKWFWFLALIMLFFIGSLLYFLIEKRKIGRFRKKGQTEEN